MAFQLNVIANGDGDEVHVLFSNVIVAEELLKTVTPILDLLSTAIFDGMVLALRSFTPLIRL